METQPEKPVSPEGSPQEAPPATEPATEPAAPAVPEVPPAEKKEDAESSDDLKSAHETHKNASKFLENIDSLLARSDEVLEKQRKGLLSSIQSATEGATVSEIDSRSIFLNNLHFAATEDEVRTTFGGCGEVVRVTILQNPRTRRPRGTAYVEFKTRTALDKALLLDRTMLHGRQLQVQMKRTNVPGMRRARAPPRGKRRGRRGMY